MSPIILDLWVPAARRSTRLLRSARGSGLLCRSMPAQVNVWGDFELQASVRASLKRVLLEVART